MARKRRARGRHRLQLDVLPQPDAVTCGPTCLHAIYRYYGEDMELRDVIDEVTALPGGGTLAVWLACHALRRGYDATIFTYNLQLFDPTWFDGAAADVPAYLTAQLRAKHDDKLRLATRAYLEFFELGGALRFEELTTDLVRRHLKRGVPVLTGLSATYLYGCARERDDAYDPIGGTPTGHFVVISGYDARTRTARIADPLHDNPRYGAAVYRVGLNRLMGAVLLGIVTYDANLLLITPRARVA
jgi:hypothetical protein